MLSNFGIILEKKNIENLDKIKKDLTIFPKENQYVKNIQSVICYKENENQILIPKFYKDYNKDLNTNINIFSPNKLFEFNGNLRKEQEENLNLIVDKLKLDLRCLYNALTGSGKTVISLKLISLINRKTLIIVNKLFLLEQWKEQINKFLGNVELGFFYGNNINIENKNIVLATIQSISMKEFDKNLFKDFNFVIFDECHHVPSNIFSKSLFKIGKKLMLGLSATPKRKDGLSQILELHFGDFLISKNTTFNNDKINVKMVDYSIDIKEKRLYNGLLNIGNLITQISQEKSRTIYFMKIIKQLYDKNRDILILSDRVEHCKIMKEILTINNIECGLFIGGLSKNERKINSEKKIIIGTYSMISEGFDIPRLNTLLMITPKTDIIQIVGRILRKKHEIIPLIIDVCDSHFQTNIWKMIRLRQYKELGLNISIKK